LIAIQVYLNGNSYIYNMKITAILTLFCLIGAYAQDTFISNVKVTYNVIRTTNNTTQELNASLLFNSSNSVFSYKTVSVNKPVSQSQEDQLNDYKLNVNVVHRDTLENHIYNEKGQNTVIKTALDFNSNQRVYIRDTIERLEWKISSESKYIQSFECIKATLKYQGSSYTAWFTTEIPTSFGPYDFGQLLGLILELYSEDHRLYIAATQITYPFEETVDLPKEDLEYISFSEYEDLNQKYLDSFAKSIKEKAVRVLTKSERGVKISNIKIETKKNNKNRKD